MRLENPSTYEPMYLTIDKLDPQESLLFYDEYILDNLKDPIIIEIEEYGSFEFTDPVIIHKTFPMD